MSSGFEPGPIVSTWQSSKPGRRHTMKATLCYVRYVVSALASIGFEVAFN
jgi:hypothetical protein